MSSRRAWLLIAHFELKSHLLQCYHTSVYSLSHLIVSELGLVVKALGVSSNLTVLPGERYVLRLTAMAFVRAINKFILDLSSFIKIDRFSPHIMFRVFGITIRRSSTT